MDLFDYMREDKMEKESPLASRLRPRTLDEIVGQQHILGRDKMLYRAIKADKLSSIILYGPPGTGKTTIAKVIANTTSAAFTQINATVAGKKDMEQVVQEAKDRMGMYGKRTILFVDEIHRFNKGQQDYLLPFVEDGTLILIGATTENPYFEVNGALISRSVIFELKPLSAEDIGVLIRRAVYDTERGMGSYGAEISDDAVDFLADMSGGDARMALNAVELGVLTTEPSADGKIHITVDVASECIQRRVMRYDKNGDNHYDTISAFIKSMRGSDPDAAIYYLARMLYAGEEPAFIARRIIICASEDVGNQILRHCRWLLPHLRRLKDWECLKPGSHWPRQQPMWPVHRRATQRSWRSMRRWPWYVQPRQLRYRLICRMPITAGQRSLDMALAISMPTTIRIIMSDSSTFRMLLRIRSSITWEIWAMRKR